MFKLQLFLNYIPQILEPSILQLSKFWFATMEQKQERCHEFQIQTVSVFPIYLVCTQLPVWTVILKSKWWVLPNIFGLHPIPSINRDSPSLTEARILLPSTNMLIYKPRSDLL